MTIEHSTGKHVYKDKGQPEFAVALASPLPANHTEHSLGAVNFLTSAEPLGALWALCGSEVEGAAMSATVNPLLTS